MQPDSTHIPLSLCPALPPLKQMPHTGQIPLSVGVTDVEQVKTESSIFLTGFSVNETIWKQKRQKGDNIQEKLDLEQKKTPTQTNQPKIQDESCRRLSSIKRAVC